MRCHYCAWQNDSHDPDCPKQGSPEMEIWRRGYRAGRSGKEPDQTGKVYRMGWNRGNVALESFENDSRRCWAD
jgi:hypothetical protein